MGLLAGDLLSLATWPTWQIGNVPSPHPALVVRVYPNGNILAFGITHSHNLCRLVVPICARNPAWAKPLGPLDPMPDTSLVCLVNADGSRAGLLFELATDGRSLTEVGIA